MHLPAFYNVGKLNIKLNSLTCDRWQIIRRITMRMMQIYVQVLTEDVDVGKPNKLGDSLLGELLVLF